MAKVYGLKHATPRMKYLHMRDMMDFKAELNRPPVSRETALSQIHQIMGGDFHAWYEEVYQLRKAGKQDEYEQAIFDKLDWLLWVNEESTCSPDESRPICRPCKARAEIREIPF